MGSIRRVFICHPDERVRNIIGQSLAHHKRVVFHPVENTYRLKNTISVVPDCRESVFLLEFRPEYEGELCREMKALCPFAEVIILISASHIPQAAELVHRGVVYDYLVVNPFYDVYSASIKVLRALERCHLRRRLVELQKQLMEAKGKIKPAVKCLTADLSRGIKEESCQLKEGVSQVVGEEYARDEVEGLFGHFDARVEGKVSEFGEDVANLTATFADSMAEKAVGAVSEVVVKDGLETGETERKEGSKRVLVVSDDSKVRDLLRLFLSAENIDVVEETGTADCVERILGQGPPPSLVLLDVDLKGQDGFRLLSLLFSDERLKEVPVILLTQTKTRRVLKKAAKYGVAGIILKPLKFSVVKEKVEQVLQESAGRGDEKRESFFIAWRKGDSL